MVVRTSMLSALTAIIVVLFLMSAPVAVLSVVNAILIASSVYTCCQVVVAIVDDIVAIGCDRKLFLLSLLLFSLLLSLLSLLILFPWCFVIILS
jgi:hypothetical protein